MYKRQDIRPAADPNMVSDSQRMIQGQMLMQRANPMLGYNMHEAELMLLRSWKFAEEDIVRILPDPKGPNAVQPPTPPKVQEAQIKIQGKLEEKKLDAQVEAAKLMVVAKESQAKIEKLQAEALLILEQADSEKAKVQIAAIDAQIGMEKNHREHLLRAIELIHTMTQDKEKSKDGANSD